MKKIKSSYRKRLFLIFTAAVSFFSYSMYGIKKDACFIGDRVEAASAGQLKIVLEAERINYQGTSIFKAVVRMDTEQAGLQAYSIYLDYDQELLEPMGIYGDDGEYDADYYQYGELRSQPVVNYAKGNVNAQYVSLSSPVNKAGSILFIAYFKVISNEEDSAKISLMEKSSFTGSNDDHTNKMIAVDADSVTKISVKLDSVEQGSHIENSENQKGESNRIENSGVSAGESSEKSGEDGITGAKPESTEDEGNMDLVDLGESEKKTDDSDLKELVQEQVPSDSKEPQNTSQGITEDVGLSEKNNAADTKEKSNAAKKVKKVKLNRTKATVKVGKTLKLTVKNTVKKIRWFSSRKKVASVNSKGKVTAKKPGTVVIKAKVKGGKVLECRITVKK